MFLKVASPLISSFRDVGGMRIFTAEPMDVSAVKCHSTVVQATDCERRAVLPGRLICMDAPKLRKLCEENHELGYVVMRRLANRDAGRLLMTRLQLLDMFAHPCTGVGRD